MSETPHQNEPPADDAQGAALPAAQADGQADGSAMIIESDDAVAPSDARVATLMEHTIDVPVLAAAIEQQAPADAADTLEELMPEGEAGDLLVAMDDVKAAEALAEMEGPLAAGVIEDLGAEGRIEYAVVLVGLMPPDDAVDVLQQLSDRTRESLLERFAPATTAGFRRLLGFDEETAAGLMTTRFVSLLATMSVGQATDRIRHHPIAEEITSLPVVDEGGRLIGVVGLRVLLVTPDDVSVGDVMERSPRAIRADLDQEAVVREFVRYDFSMMPVLDESDRAIGVVTVDDVIDTIREEQTEDVQSTVGAGKEEAVYSGVLEKYRGRAPWLILSLIMMVPSALVVKRFESLIGELAVLAVLMPIVAAVTGNAGHQALAVTLRGIILDEVRPGRVFPLVRRETIAGLLSGLTIGAALAGGVMLVGLVDDRVSWRVGAVAGIALACSILAGTSVGTCVPLAMRRVGFDPAQGGAIILIMITDAVAFATFLGLAWLTARWLLAGETAAALAAIGATP
ncbi:MAG: magnesium transporter [Phycisphaerales bacterium]